MELVVVAPEPPYVFCWRPGVEHADASQAFGQRGLQEGVVRKLFDGGVERLDQGPVGNGQGWDLGVTWRQPVAASWVP